MTLINDRDTMALDRQYVRSTLLLFSAPTNLFVNGGGENHNLCCVF